LAERHSNDPEIPFEDEALTVRGPVSETERRQAEREGSERSYRDHDIAYKDRQTRIAEGQLTTNRSLLLLTFLLVAVGFTGAYISYRAAVVAKESAEAAKSAADTAAAQLELAQRPWIYTEVEIVRWLSFDEKGGATTQIQLKTRDDGNSPAVKVYVTAELYSPTLGQNALKERVYFCGEDAVWSGGEGFVILPRAEPVEQLNELRISKQEIAESLKDPLSQRKGFTAYIIVCAGYDSTFSKRRMYTDYVYWLVRGKPRTHSSPIFKVGENVDAGELGLAPVQDGIAIR
jgi:hypothetical protein